ncbi:hypothetical protein DFH07DRAFT_950393 [Mycena maculata]|uniref:Uncharacterized protein n=1 Tax=Mycena maculata TaxID=230809 RepID=A0AAD7K6C6_9AGAR|nr:hypothetical protein DFH07DRAFT_950393 [Mycena maculata]
MTSSAQSTISLFPSLSSHHHSAPLKLPAHPDYARRNPLSEGASPVRSCSAGARARTLYIRRACHTQRRPNNASFSAALPSAIRSRSANVRAAALIMTIRYPALVLGLHRELGARVPHAMQHTQVPIPPMHIPVLPPRPTWTPERLAAWTTLLGRAQFCVEAADVEGIHGVGVETSEQIMRSLKLGYAWDLPRATTLVERMEVHGH